MSATIQDFDYSVDLLQALLWQYNDAVSLQKILEQKQNWYRSSHQGFWEDWGRDVFDLDTANDFGLSVWSVILDQPLVADVGVSPDTQAAWGFGGNHHNFGHGNFIRGSRGALRLTLDQKRMILKLRYFQLVSRGTVPELNTFLARLFGTQGAAYVLDPMDMSYAVFVLDFRPNSQLSLVLDEFDLLPRPAGVGVRILITNSHAWGFGPYHKNFDHGVFAEI